MDQIQNNIGYKYDFEISILSMKIEYKLPFNFRLMFKRGNKQNEIEKTFKYDPNSNTEVSINENFTLTCIMKPEIESVEKIDFSNPQFSEKKYKLYICIYTKTGFKPAISGEFNLSDFINSNSKNNLSEMVLSNKTFTNINIKYKINSSFIGECDLNQFSNENNETNEISKLEPDNSNFNGSSYNNNNFNNNLTSSNINKIIEPEKLDLRLDTKNGDKIPPATNNKIKLTLTATNTPTKNAISSNNVKNQNGIDESKANSNLKEKEIELEKVKTEYEEKSNELRLTINKLESKLTEEERQKQEIMDSQRIKDLEFINLVEDNERCKEDLTRYKESEIEMSNEISNLKKEIDSFKSKKENTEFENKELRIHNNSLQGKIENLNHSINNLNETIKDLREKANSNSVTNNNNILYNYGTGDSYV